MDNNVIWEVMIVPYVMLDNEAVPIRRALSLRNPCPPTPPACQGFDLIDSEKVVAHWKDPRNSTNSPVIVNDMVRDLVFDLGYSPRDITIGMIHPSEFMICPKNTGEGISEDEIGNNTNWEVYIIPFIMINGEPVPSRGNAHISSLCRPTTNPTCPSRTVVQGGQIWSLFGNSNSIQVARGMFMTLINEYGYSPLDIKVMSVTPTSIVQCR